ncbi:MAG TPA: hypothetical protein QF353_02900 [Gammaproteobacteria bacterium]|nr:hypothetical protein [Gammaproteobacteria bacterium]
MHGHKQDTSRRFPSDTNFWVNKFLKESCQEYVELLLDSIKSLIGGGIPTHTSEIYKLNVLYLRAIIQKIIVSPQVYTEFFKRNIPLYVQKFPENATGFYAMMDLKKAHLTDEQLPEFEESCNHLKLISRALSGLFSPEPTGHPNQFITYSTFRVTPFFPKDVHSKPGDKDDGLPLNLSDLETYFHTCHFLMQEALYQASLKVEQLYRQDLSIKSRPTADFNALHILESIITSIDPSTALSHHNIWGTKGKEEVYMVHPLLQETCYTSIYNNELKPDPNSIQHLTEMLPARVIHQPSIFLKQLPIDWFTDILTSHFKGILGEIFYAMPTNEPCFVQVTKTKDNTYTKADYGNQQTTITSHPSPLSTLTIEYLNSSKKLTYRHESTTLSGQYLQDGMWLINGQKILETQQNGITELTLPTGAPVRLWSQDETPKNLTPTIKYVSDQTYYRTRKQNETTLSNFSKELMWFLMLTPKHRFHNKTETRFTSEDFKHKTTGNQSFTRNGLLNCLKELNEKHNPWLYESLSQIVNYLAISELSEQQKEEVVSNLLNINSTKYQDIDNLTQSSKESLYAQIEFAAKSALFRLNNEIMANSVLSKEAFNLNQSVDDIQKTDHDEATNEVLLKAHDESILHTVLNYIDEKKLTLNGIIDQVGTDKLIQHHYKIIEKIASVTNDSRFDIFHDFVELLKSNRITFNSFQLKIIMDILIKNNHYDEALLLQKQFQHPNPRMPRVKLDLFTLEAAAESGNLQTYKKISQNGASKEKDKKEIKPSNTTFFKAIRSGNSQLVKYIFDHTRPSSFAFFTYESSIHKQVSKMCLIEAAAISMDMLKTVCSYGKGYFSTNYPTLPQECLHSAIAIKDIEFVHQLLNGLTENHNPLLPDKKSMEAAAMSGDLDFFKEVLAILVACQPDALLNPLLQHNVHLARDFENLYKSSIQSCIKLAPEVLLKACTSSNKEGGAKLVEWLTETENFTCHDTDYEFLPLKHNNLSIAEVIKSGNLSLLNKLAPTHKNDDFLIAAAESGNSTMFEAINNLSEEALKSLTTVSSSGKKSPTPETAPSHNIGLFPAHLPKSPRHNNESPHEVVIQQSSSSSPPRNNSNTLLSIRPITHPSKDSKSDINRALIVAAIDGGNKTIFTKVVSQHEKYLDCDLLAHAKRKEAHDITQELVKHPVIIQQELISSTNEAVNHQVEQNYQCQFLKPSPKKIITNKDIENMKKMFECRVQHPTDQFYGLKVTSDKLEQIRALEFIDTDHSDELNKDFHGGEFHGYVGFGQVTHQRSEKWVREKMATRLSTNLKELSNGLNPNLKCAIQQVAKPAMGRP